MTSERRHMRYNHHWGIHTKSINRTRYTTQEQVFDITWEITIKCINLPVVMMSPKKMDFSSEWKRTFLQHYAINKYMTYFVHALQWSLIIQAVFSSDKRWCTNIRCIIYSNRCSWTIGHEWMRFRTSYVNCKF